MAGLLLAGPSASLRAKLTEKTRYRATALIKPLLPSGSSSLETVPMLVSAGVESEPTEEALAVRSYLVA